DNLRAIASPVANESLGPATSIDVSTRSVFSNRVTVTDSDRSRTVVPWISPALEQPITTDLGYARASSANGAGSSRSSGAPKASTRVRGESRAGSAGTDHRFVS